MTMPTLIRPPRLQPGDTVAVVSPSFGAPGYFPHRLHRGVAYLESLGLQVRVSAAARGVEADRPWLSASAQARADDLHAAFVDPDVRAVLASIGGDHSNQLLPLLDMDLIAAHPTILLGLSDITVLHVAIHAATGLVTFNGPAVCDSLAEYPAVPPFTDEFLRRALFAAEPIGDLRPAETWTDEFLDWGAQLDLTRPRVQQPGTGWAWLLDGAHAAPVRGPLLGGCLESLEHLRGTRWWPDWQGRIAFLETSEEVPAPERIDSMLSDWANMGVLDAIAGLLWARPYGYTPDAVETLHEVLRGHCAPYGFPVVSLLDFGHTDPKLTLPNGVLAEIDPQARRVRLLDAAVTERS